MEAKMEANILVVNTMKDLLKLSQNEINKYGGFSLRGYHKIDDTVYFYGYWKVVYYIWNPESTKEHNGGTIIDPDAPFPKDWNNEQQLEKWFNYESDTKGRFELIVGDNTVNVKWFGAKGDGVTDDSIAIQKAIDTKMKVFSSDGYYALKDPLIFHEGQKAMLFGCFSNMKTNSSNRLKEITIKDQKECKMIQPEEETVVLGREEWEEKYLPIMDEDNYREMYYTWGKEFEKRLTEIEPDETKRDFHIWTLMTDDNGNMIINSGFRFVNRLEYIITKKPWKIGEYIVVDYEKER